jgi:probable HAF family extracellular repeat protein
MKKITMLFVVACLVLLFAASTCFAQMYTVTDLGTLGGTYSFAQGINESGQVAGFSPTNDSVVSHPFRTAANNPINPATDDLGTLSNPLFRFMQSAAYGINASGQVVGDSNKDNDEVFHGFRTAPNSAINPATDDLGTIGYLHSFAQGINDSGQVVGSSTISIAAIHAFRTSANSPINPATDDLGTLGGSVSFAQGINALGQVVGHAAISDDAATHAFRTAANSPINPATDDLGTLGGSSSASHINLFGQAVGMSGHAFRTAPNSPINPATDDLGTLGGSSSSAASIDDYGQVVGWAYTAGDTAQHAFLYSGGVMHDLNNMIPAGSACELVGAADMNDAGQIAANGNCGGQQRAVLLTPVYKAFVQRPIHADGSSVFKAARGTVPVKFTLTQYDAPTCTLPPATIAITRAAGGTLASVDEGIYSTQADRGSNFRIDPTACQYIYKLAASSLGAGAYLVDISIQGIFVGHAVFSLK